MIHRRNLLLAGVGGLVSLGGCSGGGQSAEAVLAKSKAQAKDSGMDWVALQDQTTGFVTYKSRGMNEGAGTLFVFFDTNSAQSAELWKDFRKAPLVGVGVKWVPVSLGDPLSTQQAAALLSIPEWKQAEWMDRHVQMRGEVAAYAGRPVLSGVDQKVARNTDVLQELLAKMPENERAVPFLVGAEVGGGVYLHVGRVSPMELEPKLQSRA